VQPVLFDQVFHGSVLYREGARDAVTVTDRPELLGQEDSSGSETAPFQSALMHA
jgi:hypothetical protein